MELNPDEADYPATRAWALHCLHDGDAASRPQVIAALDTALTRWQPGEETRPPPRTQAAMAGPASQPVQSAMDNLSQGMNVQIALIAPNTGPGAPVSISLRSSRSAYAYCYIQDVAGTVARVFPNRWQPDPLIMENREVHVPGQGAGFDLVLPQAGTQENMVCFVSSAELGAALPTELKSDDLTPLPVPSLDALKSRYSQTARDLNGDLVVRELSLQAE